MVNRVVLIGRLGADPELRAIPSGVAVCSVRLAVDRRFKNQQGERETDWIDVVAWRQQAEFLTTYAKKGQMIAVDGSLRTRTWQSQSGEPRKAYEVVAEQVQLLSPRSSGAGPSSAPTASHGATEAGTSDQSPPQFEQAFGDMAADVDLYE